MSENDLVYPGGKLRLYLDAPLGAALRVVSGEKQAHYLLHVMRAKVGDRIGVFNGRDGEWTAHVADISKRGCTLLCDRQTSTQTEVPDIWLCFAPIKRTPADYVAQKATELGVRCLQPVLTRRTIVGRVNVERMRANAIEAAEQSGRTSVPETREPLHFDKFLQTWPSDRRLLFCDEGGDAKPIAATVLPDLTHACAILTGPEGGFDPIEREKLRSLSFVVPVTLGPRILRADTAALAALAIWQSVGGDWR